MVLLKTYMFQGVSQSANQQALSKLGTSGSGLELWPWDWHRRRELDDNISDSLKHTQIELNRNIFTLLPPPSPHQTQT